MLSKFQAKRRVGTFLSLFFLLFVSSFAYAQNDFKVQRGVATVAGNTVVLNAPADFDAVASLNYAFVRITNSQHTGAGDDVGGGNQNADDTTAHIEFNSTSQITITRLGTGSPNTRVCWEIVEYIGTPGDDNEFIVREQGVHTFTGGVATETNAFTGASGTAQLVGFVTGVANPDTGRNDYESGLVTTSFDDASTLRFTRGSADDAIQVSYAVVDFIGANWTIERISHTYTAAGAAEQEATAVTDLSTAFIHAQKRNDADLRGLDEFGHQVWLSAANAVSFQLRSGATTPNGQTSVAWIISNPDMTVTRSNGNIATGGAEPLTATLNIVAVSDLTNTSLFWNNDVSGTGVAYPRPMVAVRLTAVDTIEYWRSDTGQTVDYRYEVVEWPKPPVPYAVTYDGNGNDGGTEPVDGSSPYLPGTTVTVLSEGTLTLTGNSFLSWNTAADGSGTTYAPAATFSMPNNAVTLYAQWGATPLNIAGTVYTDEAKTTPIAAGTGVSVSINGAAPLNTTTNGSGQFSVAGTVNADDVIAAYLNVADPVSSYHAVYTTATGTNITEGNDNNNLATTNLLDVSDGSDSGYDIAINYLLGMTTGTGGGDKDATGGDAFSTFNGVINLGVEYSYTPGGTADGTDFGTITFSNLDTNKLYTVVLYHNRDASADRITRYTISGIDSATQSSSTGVTVISPTSVEYDVDNTADGYVAKWTDIDPNGTDFVITLTKGGGDYAYTPLAIMLQEQVAASSSGSLITKSDGVTDLTGGNQLELVTGKVILEHQTGTEITNTDLDVIDGIDAGDDDGITIAGGNATFASNREVWISSGDTYNPGGNVSLADLEFAGTFNAGANTINVSGSWDNNGGTFVGGTSTVDFISSATANIDGSSTFFNFSCAVPDKKLIFEQGSTQTISGLFSLQGERSTSTRIALESSGGPGTTWNLIINGNHDCNYVDSQGANVSTATTVYLPINPAGYMNSGDNTNMYDPALPEDVLFYDNFENSTLGSASPDRPSSNWTINGAGWITSDAETVNTQNVTPGGSQSLYSEPVAANFGDASWNNPEWGPVVNGVAQVWFYDDMNDGAGKRIWASVESSDGQEWAAIGISTPDSATKYCYHIGLLPTTDIVTVVTYIDRSVGWHKATWVRDSVNLTLYLDDVQIYQGANVAVDNFADFDLGSWDYDTQLHSNGNGTTAMWFDDCSSYRSQHQSAYRWYENDDAANPTAIDAENTAISREIAELTRVRIQATNDMAMDWGTYGAYIGLQYREGTVGAWEDLSAANDWEYANGLGTDGATLPSALLTGTNILNQYIESQPSPQLNLAASNETSEWDFALQATSKATVGATYYFRLVVTDAAGAFLREFAAYPYLAECQITSPTIWIWTGAVSSDWDDPANWTPPSGAGGQTLPDITSDVLIQTAGVNNDPVINITGAVCKSLVLQTGRTLGLTDPNTDLTVAGNVTIFGTVNHTNNTADLTVNSGEIRIDGGTYNHSGNGTLDAANADLRIINGANYNFTGQGQIDLKDFYIDNFGAFNDTTAAGTMNVELFSIVGNGQFTSDQTGSIYNVSGDFVNNGSMLGTTGGVFNFTGTGKTYSGSAVNHVFYQANFTGSYTVTTTEDINFLDDVTIGGSGSLTASTGTLYVGGDWTNNNTFVHGSGTVNFNGTALQQITTGGSDYYNLVVSNGSGAGVSFLDGFTTTNFVNITAGSTMTFNAGSTYTITGDNGLTLIGAAGNEINLVSSTPGSFWLIDPAGVGWGVDYVNVTDSININADVIDPSNSIDGGNNIGWFGLDIDGDEIPDYFEYIHYGALGNGPLSDTDGDGLNLLEEFILDSDPNVGGTRLIYVDDNAGYIGDGTPGAPFKYLKDALDDVGLSGAVVELAEGTYELDDYTLTQKVIIRGVSPEKTIIHGGAPDGGSSDSGSFLHVSSKDFGLTQVTLRLFRDDKPIISYDGSKTFALESVVFKDNNTQTKSLIATLGVDRPKYFYMFNTLFYNNTALSAAEMDATKDANSYNNTIVNNTFTSALILEGSSKRYNLLNNILRNSSTEITDNTASGTVIISNCNIEGGYVSAINSYDAAETFADAANGYYRLLTGSAGENAGITTRINWDQDGVSRPQGAGFEVGCYETVANDQDGDGLTDAEETVAGSSPTDPDSDGDGINDGEEVNTWGTNPMSTNSDSDFIDDGYEPPMGMDPAVNDGDGDIDGVYYTSFENPAQFPVGPVEDTIWGPNGNANNTNVIKGNMTIENVGAVAAYDGTHVAKCEGNPGGGLVETSFVGWVDRNGLDNYWISISYKMPRAELPTDINEAMNVAGAFFAIDENGYLNAWDPSNEEWLKDTQVIPDDWVRITVHRDHPGKIVNIWVETRQAFANVPIVDPDPTAGTGKFRMSMSSVGEEDSYSDLWSSLPFAPF